MTIQVENVMTVAEFARWYGVGTDAVYKWMRDKKLPEGVREIDTPGQRRRVGVLATLRRLPKEDV